MTVSVLCYVLAFVCFVLAAVAVRGPWVAVGLALFALGHCLVGVTFGKT